MNNQLRLGYEGQRLRQKVEEARQNLTKAEVDQALVEGQLEQVHQKFEARQVLYAQHQHPDLKNKNLFFFKRNRFFNDRLFELL
jgi:hypothetical protein